MLVDSHCHLDFPDFSEDFPAMLARARQAGVSHCLTISTKLRTFPAVRKIAEEHATIFCTVGIHPHEADQEGVGGMEMLLENATHPKVVGLGETGLDYYYDHSDRARQRESFRAHILAAQESGLPLVIHCRDAEDDVMSMLEEARGPRLSGVIHCFTGTRKFADFALDLGFYISLSGIVTFKNAQALQEIARHVPAERLLIETDAPYLAPVPMRGRRNEPAFVRHTLGFLAGLRGESEESLAAATSANFFALFSKATA
ncbi:MAG TPA: TatD family hydrolase [Dongiaceae bacterium]|jgi:TatD DNase family protein|nr:TatD family hydrolase [Dongiaceae bacterium]